MRDVLAWKRKDVGLWLEHIEMPYLKPLFKKKKIRGSDLLGMTTLDSISSLECDKNGWRQCLIQHVRELLEAIETEEAIRTTSSPPSSPITFHKMVVTH